MPSIRPRVLIADDYVPLLSALRRFLEPECELVAGVTTVAQVVEEATRQHPDVVVVDFSLPETDGLDACRQLRVAHPNVKVIILTAADDARVREAALAAGASEFVPKSLVHERLLPAIRLLWSQGAPPDRSQAPGSSIGS